MSFWLISTILALCATALLVLALRRGAAQARPAAEFDLNVFRDQLAEVERDQERGVLAPDDAERLRTEISRRILAADTALRTQGAEARSPAALRYGAIGAMGLCLVAGSLLLYRDLGAPGYGDLGLAVRLERIEEARRNRPDQATAQAAMPPSVPLDTVPQDYIELVSQLRAAVAARPDDLQGATLLALHERRLNNPAAAARAQEQVLRIKGDQASAEDYALYAEMLIAAAGGSYISPQAEAALSAALRRDSKHESARYYYGLALAETGRPDLAFRVWNSLLRDGPSDPAMSRAIVPIIGELAALAGVDDYEIPDTVPRPAGPSAEQIEDAGEMSAEDRAEMIQGMVDRLSERLGSEGGPPEDWAQLIRALGVLGDADGAALIWQDARNVFEDSPEALAIVRAAARELGITQ